MNTIKSAGMLLLLSLVTVLSFAQDATVTDTNSSKEVNYTENTFYSTRVVNGQSTEGITQNRLDFRIEHRFDLIKT